MRYPLLVALVIAVLLSFMSVVANMNTAKQNAELHYYCQEVEAGQWADFEGKCKPSKARAAQLKKLT